MKLLQTMLLVTTLGAIAVVVFWEASRNTSPGPLHPVHAQVAALAGNAGCARCHGVEGSGAMRDACATCHADVAGQLDAGVGLHGSLDVAVGCGTCHTEHHGSDVEPVGAHAFALADVPDRDRYDHRHVAGFALGGAHATLACQECHEHADVPVLPDGATRFLGLDTTCTGCHEDAHAGALGAECARCHGQSKPFAQVGEFRHRRFAQDGAHAALRCVACHAKGSPQEIAALEGLDPEPRSCVECHGEAHAIGGTALPIGAALGRCADCHDTQTFARSFDVAAHAAVGASLDGAHARADCSGCHTEARASAPRNAEPMRRCTDCHADVHGPVGTAVALATEHLDCAKCHDPVRTFAMQFDAASHADRGIALRGAHADAECASCHTTARAATAPRTNPMERCADCHESPHRDGFLAALAGPNAQRADATCVICHADDHPRFGTARIDGAQHAASGFPLTAPHAEVECASCHGAGGARSAVTPATFAERFPGRRADDCAACHADPHGGQFAQRADAGRCTACHDATRFLPPSFDLDRHADCGFAIDGAHRAVACDRCHTAADGAVRTFVGTARDCAACHADVHQGAFDAPGLPTLIDGRASCARCHETSSFDAVGDGFDHALFARFPLVGGHAAADCAACHGRSAVPDADGRTLGAAPNACAQCHQDPHAGQFARPRSDGSPATDCARCHDAARDFTDLDFDHDRDTRFALDASHQALACAQCHKPFARPGRQPIVRYRPLGTACADCHGGKERRR